MVRISRAVPGRTASIFQDHVARLLADHVNGCNDEEPGNLRKDGGINDPQVARAVDAEVPVHNCLFIVLQPYLRTDNASFITKSHLSATAS